MLTGDHNPNTKENDFANRVVSNCAGTKEQHNSKVAYYTQCITYRCFFGYTGQDSRFRSSDIGVVWQIFRCLLTFLQFSMLSLHWG